MSGASTASKGCPSTAAAVTPPLPLTPPLATMWKRRKATSQTASFSGSAGITSLRASRST
jgi:hypothetical protein